MSIASRKWQLASSIIFCLLIGLLTSTAVAEIIWVENDDELHQTRGASVVLTEMDAEDPGFLGIRIDAGSYSGIHEWLALSPSAVLRGRWIEVDGEVLEVARLGYRLDDGPVQEIFLVDREHNNLWTPVASWEGQAFIADLEDASMLHWRVETGLRHSQTFSVSLVGLSRVLAEARYHVRGEFTPLR